MSDFETLERKLHENADLRRRFMLDPVSLLREQGIILTRPQEKALQLAVKRANGRPLDTPGDILCQRKPFTNSRPSAQFPRSDK